MMPSPMNASECSAPQMATTTASQRSLSNRLTMRPPGTRGNVDVDPGQHCSRRRSASTARRTRCAGRLLPSPGPGTTVPRVLAHGIRELHAEGALVTDRPAAAPVHTFSLLDDPLMRLLRALRLAPREGFHAPGRGLLAVVVTWVPIMVWAAATGQLAGMAWAGGAVHHLEMHVRCLVAIPLLIFSEPIADRLIGAIVDNFPVSGLIRDEDEPAFDRAVASVKGLRDSKLAWGLIVALVTLTTLVSSRSPMDAAVVATSPDAGGFGSRWAMFVVRPLFLLMVFAWVWRLVLTWILFVRIARLDLQLVPSHPDKVGGLGFVQLQPAAFSLVVFTISGVVCASVAEQIVEQHLHLAQF